MRKLAVLFLLIVAMPVQAQVKPRLTQAQVSGNVGELIVVAPNDAKVEVAYFFDAREFGSKHAVQYGTTLVLTTNKPGTYSINAVIWEQKRIESILVIVGGHPTPPVPPNPPTPPDAFTASIIEAWQMESTADKEKIKLYAAFFSEMSKAVNDPSLKTVKDLRESMSKARKSLVGESLRHVAKVIGADLNENTPHTGEVVLTTEIRNLYAAHFVKYAAALEYCK